jgi:signal transduction histidine kinase
MVTLKQLNRFLHNIDHATVTASGAFLAKQVPFKLQSLVQQHLRPQTAFFQHHRELLSATQALTEALDLSANQLETALKSSEVGKVVEAFNPLDQQISQYFKLVQIQLAKNPHLRVAVVQDMLQNISKVEIAVKVMLEHHLYGLEKLTKANVDFEPSFMRYGLVSEACLEDIVEDTVAHVKSLSIHHFSAHPRIEIDKSEVESNAPSALVVESQIHYIIMELLKNSVKAIVDRYGALDLDQDSTPPVMVKLSAKQSSGFYGVQIVDQGFGIPMHLRNGESSRQNSGFRLFEFFSSTVKEDPNPTYTYSRQFGPPFSGFGSGLAVSRNYAELVHGGAIEVSSLPKANTTSTLWFDRFGSNEF